VRSPSPLPVSVPPAAWSAVACLVVVSTVHYALVSGADAQARRVQLAEEHYDQTRRERRLFWRTVVISTFVAIVVAARIVLG
jgi:type IV secretory pathway component VirB8